MRTVKLDARRWVYRFSGDIYDLEHELAVSGFFIIIFPLENSLMGGGSLNGLITFLFWNFFLLQKEAFIFSRIPAFRFLAFQMALSGSLGVKWR